MNLNYISSQEPKQESQAKALFSQRKPAVLKLKNMTNQPEQNQLKSLKLRIDELQIKISQLQAKIKSKKKRIRRKSSEVQKRHKCQFCKKMYGSLVSLNLHLRIKHKREAETAEKDKEELKNEQNQPSYSQQRV